jgi:4-hydroxy-3-methylbut-2-enyl diphosphate reductase
LAGSNDVVLVIGSSASANSSRLFEIAKSINPRSYFFEKASDIKSEWLAGAKSAAVAAGASTPGWIIEEVLEKLENV